MGFVNFLLSPTGRDAFFGKFAGCTVTLCKKRSFRERKAEAINLRKFMAPEVRIPSVLKDKLTDMRFEPRGILSQITTSGDFPSFSDT